MLVSFTEKGKKEVNLRNTPIGNTEKRKLN